jgi:hypothetical protein
MERDSSLQRLDVCEVLSRTVLAPSDEFRRSIDARRRPPPSTTRHYIRGEGGCNEPHTHTMMGKLTSTQVDRLRSWNEDD